MLSQITKITLDTNTWNATLYSHEIGKLSSITGIDLSGPGIIGTVDDFINKSNLEDITLLLPSGSTSNFEINLNTLESLETLNTNCLVTGELDLASSGLSYLSLETNPGIAVITYTGSTWKSGWYYMNLKNCNMSEASCDNLLIAADASGIEDETSGANPPTLLLTNNSRITALGLNALQSLESKGWTVDADWPVYSEITLVAAVDEYTYTDFDTILFSGKSITIDWGDGSDLEIFSSSSGNFSHDYLLAGTYTIKYYSPENINGFQGGAFPAGSNKVYINFETSVKRMLNLTSLNLRSGSSSNRVITGKLEDLPRKLITLYFENVGTATDDITGNIGDLPTTLDALEFIDNESPDFNLDGIVGDISELSNRDDLEYIRIFYTNIPAITYEDNLSWGKKLYSLKVENSVVNFSQNSVNLAVRDAKNSPREINGDLYIKNTGYTVTGEYVQDLISLLNNSWDVSIQE